MGLGQYERAVTYFHEVGHAWEHETGKKIPHDIIEWQAKCLARFFEENT
jgi:Zn-dependent peptidase ImmA (M78 family)